MKKTGCILLMMLCAFSLAFGQTTERQTTADILCVRAIEMIDRGEPDRAIELLREALELEPKSCTCWYEMAYAYYVKQDYRRVIRILKPLTKYDDCFDLVYVMLGNSYDNAGKPERAIGIYDRGLIRFPHSGRLCLERGVVRGMMHDYNGALFSFEQGIRVEPMYPSNYYRATQLYSASVYPVWSMVYGELFLNLQPQGERADEIRRYLYESYGNRIALTADSVSVSFSAPVDAGDPADSLAFSLNSIFQKYYAGFGPIYEQGIQYGAAGERTITLASLHRIREKWLDYCLREQEKNNNRYDKEIVVPYLAYLKEIRDAGHAEAYDYWLLREGDPSEFEEWLEGHRSEYHNFMRWAETHRLNIPEPLDEDHVFRLVTRKPGKR